MQLLIYTHTITDLQDCRVDCDKLYFIILFGFVIGYEDIVTSFDIFFPLRFLLSGYVSIVQV